MRKEGRFTARREAIHPNELYMNEADGTEIER
jgi:hypothetical protein